MKKRKSPSWGEITPKGDTKKLLGSTSNQKGKRRKVEEEQRTTLKNNLFRRQKTERGKKIGLEKRPRQGLNGKIQEKKIKRAVTEKVPKCSEKTKGLQIQKKTKSTGGKDAYWVLGERKRRRY